jgi:hypothetical protein
MEFVFASAPVIRGFDADEDYSLSISPVTISSPAGGITGTQRDAQTLVSMGTNVDSVFSVQLTDSPNDGTVITNLTPGVATFSGSATATYVSNGIAQIQGVNSTLGTRLVTSLVQRTVAGSSTSFTGYIAGAIAADLSTLISGAITGVTASAATTARFSSLTNNTRNAGLWSKNILNDSPISREATGFTLIGLIGPHHILTAAHVAQTSGQVGFVGTNGVGYVGTIVNGTTITGTDISVGYVRDATGAEITAYNNAHPSSKAATGTLSQGISGGYIVPMAMFPGGTWATSNAYLCLDSGVANLPNFAQVPVIHSTKNNALGIWGISAPPTTVVYTGGVAYSNEFGIIQSNIAAEAPFSAYANVGGSASGDLTLTAIPAATTLASANPGLGVGYPILLGCTHGLGSGQFDIPWISLYISQITTAMQSTAQSAGDPSYASYSPIQVSLAGYSTY